MSGTSWALFKWNKPGLNPGVFRDERTAWGLRNCLKKMGEFDRDVLKLANEMIMKRTQWKREGIKRKAKRDRA